MNIENINIYVAITVILTIILIILELFFPGREYTKEKKKLSYSTNILIFVSNNIVTYLLQVSAIAVVITSLSPATDVYTTLPLWMQGVLGVVLLDISIWLWHMLNHKISFLWMFHKCHHSEQHLNASSALRFHIGELLLSVMWKSAVLLLLGIPLWVFLLSEFLLTAFALFHHANISMSERARKYVELLIITPYLHRVHHSDIRDEHDSNYGVLFSVWDRIFNTMKKLVPDKIGLQGISEKNFFRFLTFPFQKK